MINNLHTYRVPLKKIKGGHFLIKEHNFIAIKEDIEKFLSDEKNMNTKEFAKKVMFTHEIKANNYIEGINDDIFSIEEAIMNPKNINREKRDRIVNLYHGYKYILKQKDINKESVKKLYKILSEDLLEEQDKSRMGKYYREAPVYILEQGRIDKELKQGLDYRLINEYMDVFFDYVNSSTPNYTSIDHFIKSQIMHFYFVYIHPYFDVNGRTSRTISMWYLLLKEAYPFIIFNRAITSEKSRYDKTIAAVEENNDLSKFLTYMLKNVKLELEKEYVMQSIASTNRRRFTTLDYQTLEYFISMNGLKTVLDFASSYNNSNDKLKIKEIYETMLLPLIDDGVILIERETHKNMFNESKNQVLKLNLKRVDYNKDKIKNLIL